LCGIEIDLVQQHVRAVRAGDLFDCFEGVRVSQHTARVVRVGEDDQAGPLGHCMLHAFRIQREPVVELACEPVHASTEKSGRAKKRIVSGRFDEDLVAGLEEGRARQEICTRGSLCGRDLRGVDAVSRGDCFEQRLVPVLVAALEADGLQHAGNLIDPAGLDIAAGQVESSRRSCLGPFHVGCVKPERGRHDGDVRLRADFLNQ